MTREQAINYLISSGFNQNQVSEIVRALTYEPTTKKDLGVDCISRQSVLDKIQRLINAEQNNIDENGDYMNYARERVNAYEAIQFFVENDCLCPSVTPQEPRKGHWISHREHCDKNNLIPSGLGSYFWCSECDCGIDSENFSRVNYNYCPNCGADMRTSEEV